LPSNSNLPNKRIDIVDIERYGAHKRLVSILKKKGYTKFRVIQQLSIENGLFKGVSQFICSPSGSGKTLIGELAAVNNILNKKGKSIYLVPLRALAGEKRDYFLEMYGKYGINIIMGIGDQVVPIEELYKADLIVMTYEKFDSYLRLLSENKWIYKISTVIIDEVHIIGDDRRGPRLESIILRLFLNLNQFQFIALSATVGNPEELSFWFEELHSIKSSGLNFSENPSRSSSIVSTVNSEGFYTILHNKRPIELNYGIIPTNNKIRAIIDLIQPLLTEQHQALIFTNSRHSAEEIAEKISDFVEMFVKSDNVFDIEDKESMKFIKFLIESVDFSENLLNLIKKGVGYHHGGLDSAERYIVEKLFLLGKIKIIICTSTLSAGINTPARMVILSDLELYDQKIKINSDFSISKNFIRKNLPKNTFHQILGRAGRPGFDIEGIARILVNNDTEALQVQNYYFKPLAKSSINLNQNPQKFIPAYDNILSKLYNRNNLMEFILLTIFEHERISLSQLDKIIYYTLSEFIKPDILNVLIKLQIRDKSIFQIIKYLSIKEDLIDISKCDYILNYDSLKITDTLISLQFYLENKNDRKNINKNAGKNINRNGSKSINKNGSNINNDVNNSDSDRLNEYTIIFDYNKGIYCNCDGKYYRINFNVDFSNSNIHATYNNSLKLLRKKYFLCQHRILALLILEDLIQKSDFYIKKEIKGENEEEIENKVGKNKKTTNSIEKVSNANYMEINSSSGFKSALEIYEEYEKSKKKLKSNLENNAKTIKNNEQIADLNKSGKNKKNDFNDNKKQANKEIYIEISPQNPLCKIMYLDNINANSNNPQISRMLAQLIIEKVINQAIRGQNIIEFLIQHNFISIKHIDSENAYKIQSLNQIDSKSKKTMNKYHKISSFIAELQNQFENFNRNNLDLINNPNDNLEANSLNDLEEIIFDELVLKDIINLINFPVFLKKYISFESSKIFLFCTEAGKSIIKGYVFPHTALIFEKLLRKYKQTLIGSFSKFPLELFSTNFDSLKSYIQSQIIENNPPLANSLIDFYIKIILNLLIQEDRNIPIHASDILKMKLKGILLQDIYTQINERILQEGQTNILYFPDLRNFIEYTGRIFNFIKDYLLTSIEILKQNLQNTRNIKSNNDNYNNNKHEWEEELKYYSIIVFFINYFQKMIEDLN